MSDAMDQLRQQTRAALKTAGVSQAEASRSLGVSTKHLSQMLTGRAPLTLDWADQLLALCGQQLLVAVVPEAAAPAPAQVPRTSLDDFTSDQLDALYDELDRLKQRVQDWKQAAGAGMTNTDSLRAERDALAAGVPLVCSDERHKAKVFALEIEIARLTDGQGADSRPVAGCPYPKRIAAREQAERPFGDRHGPTPEEVRTAVRRQSPASA